jgi:predicted small lipoprotein YifL
MQWPANFARECFVGINWAVGLMSITRVLVVAAAIAALAVVSGCGRKSGLDTPYEAAVQARKDAEKAKEPLPPEPKKPVEDRPFLLDGLIN